MPSVEATLESSAFDCSEIQIYSVNGVEQLSQPFRFEVEAVSLAADALALDDIVGAEVSIVLARGGAAARRVHGIVTEAARLPETAPGTRAYRLVVGPRLLRAQYVLNFKVHVDTSIRNLITQRLAMLGLVEEVDFRLHLQDELPVRPLVIQYRETDFAFLSRILEQYGLCYYFVCDDDRDRLAITDNAAGFDRSGDTVNYRPNGDACEVYEIGQTRRLVMKTYVCRDYNYRAPHVRVQSDRVILEQGDFGGLLDFGSHVATADEATRLARRLSEQQLAQRDLYQGKSDIPAFAPGRSFSLQGHEYAHGLTLVSVEHALRQTAAGVVQETGQRYVNRFTAIASDRVYRPPLTTPVPRIGGLVHAVVQTDAAGTIAKRPSLDQEGRYLVKFRFDTSVTEDGQAASCRVRMLQPSAGPGFGTHFPLRPGVEVMCAFVDGNPDRPVIVGAAPNPLSPSPVNASTGNKSRIATGSGALIEFEDG